jgi:hypothetical protein
VLGHSLSLLMFGSWQAYIFYLYTGDITFAPLASELSGRTRDVAADYHTKYPHKPSPCSPKSTYRLAEKVRPVINLAAIEHLSLTSLTCKLGDKSLQDRALEAIGHRLSEYNIVDELFSKFTST